MAVTPKTLKIKMNFAPLRWELRRVGHIITTMFNKPWNLGQVHDRRKLRRLVEHMEVLEALADD